MEPKIIINGTRITEAESMTIRVAMTDFTERMTVKWALGNDATGEAIREGYLNQSRSVLERMFQR